MIKILAIDDNFDNLITIQALVSESFPTAKILLSTNGKEGFEIAIKENPDVILLDIIMPEMDGFEFCEKIKADDFLSDIPVVFVTALKGDKESRIRCLNAGGEAFLAKPIDESELVAQIRAMVKIKTANVQKRNENVQLAALVSERTQELNQNHIATLNLLEDLKEENEFRRHTEQALIASEALYRSVIQASPDNITVTDLGGNISMISPKGLLLIGSTSEDEIIGKSINDFLIPEHKEKAIKNIASMFKGIFNGPEEYTLVKANGETVDTEINAEFVRGINGDPTRLIFSIRDITERKQTQNAIRESERKYRLITEKISDVVWVLDLTGKSIFVSQSIENFTGYTVEEFLTQTFNDRFTPESAKMASQNLSIELSKYKNGELALSDYKKMLVADYLCKDGSIKTGELLISPYLDENNELVGFHGVTRDITERKVAEKALRESEVKFREMADLLPQVVFEITLSGEITYVNQQAKLLFGYEENELLGKNSQMVHIEEERRRAINGIRRKLEGKSVENKEFSMIRKDGTIFPALIFINAIKRDNVPVGLRGIVIDITEQKLAEEALQQSRNELQTIYDFAPVMMCVLDVNRNIIFTNNAFNRLVNTSALPINFGQLGNTIGCVNALQDSRGCGYSTDCAQCALRKSMVDTLSSGIRHQNIEYNGTIQTGNEKKEISLLGSTSLIQSGDKSNLLLCLHDITDRKLVEDALQKSEMLLRTFIDNSPFEIWARDTENRGILENKRLVEHYGSIIGSTPHTDPRIDEKTLQFWEKINSRAFSGEVIDEEYEFKVNNDDRIFEQIVFPVRNSEKIIGIAGFNIDITDRKHADEALRESREELKKFAAHLQNVREEERILLAREIHDQLGQILVAVKIDMGMLKQNVLKNIENLKPEELKQKFDDLSTLIDNTIKTSRKIMTDLRPEVLDMIGLIESVKQHLDAFQQRHKTLCRLENNCSNLNLTSQQAVTLFRIIQEAMNNIAKHAKATEVRVIVQQENDNLVLEVVDNGLGFDQKNKNNVESYGLIGMKERVFLIEGKLNIFSKIGEGTTIQVKIPYKDEKLE